MDMDYRDLINEAEALTGNPVYTRALNEEGPEDVAAPVPDANPTPQPAQDAAGPQDVEQEPQVTDQDAILRVVEGIDSAYDKLEAQFDAAFSDLETLPVNQENLKKLKLYATQIEQKYTKFKATLLKVQDPNQVDDLDEPVDEPVNLDDVNPKPVDAAQPDTGVEAQPQGKL